MKLYCENKECVYCEKEKGAGARNLICACDQVTLKRIDKNHIDMLQCDECELDESVKSAKSAYKK